MGLYGCSRAPGPVADRGPSPDTGVRFYLLDSSLDLPPDVSVLLQSSDAPRDRLLLAVLSPNHMLSNVGIELRVGGEVLLPYQRFNVDVGPAEMIVLPVVLSRAVIADPSTWEDYWLQKGGIAAVEAAGEHEEVVVSRFDATVQ